MVNTSHNTQPQHTAPATSKKHWNHDLRLPASSGFNFTGECDRRTSCDRYRSPQYGDAIFFNETNCFFLFYWLLLKAADRRALGQKVCFFSEYMCFFLAVASNQRALTPDIRRYIFRQCRPVLIMFWYDFGRGEWGRHCHGWCWRWGGRVGM